MSTTLATGHRINLEKTAPGLTRVRIGLGWKVNAAEGQAFDLDSSVFLCAKNANDDPVMLSNAHFVYYNHTTSPDGAVVHSGDNRTGDKDGDDEVITVDLSRVDSLDTVGAWTAWRVARDEDAEIVGASEEANRLIEAVKASEGKGEIHPERGNLIERVPESGTALLLHLDDEQPAPAAEDEVELVATDSDVRADEPIAPQAVMPECDSLAPVHAA